MSIHDVIYTKKSRKIAYHPDEHIPNKNESKVLRKIMAESGLTEEQVRSDVTHRRTLAEAQKAGEKPKRNATKKWYQDRIKEACKVTGLVPQHPETIKVLDEILKERVYSWRRPWFFFGTNPNAKTVVRDYAKK